MVLSDSGVLFKTAKRLRQSS